ncbi:hypothetical protein, partial [Komagataeibacter xylinus]
SSVKVPVLSPSSIPTIWEETQDLTGPNRAVAKAGIYHFFVSLEPQVAFNLMSSTPLPRTGFYPGQKAAFA